MILSKSVLSVLLLGRNVKSQNVIVPTSACFFYGDKLRILFSEYFQFEYSAFLCVTILKNSKIVYKLN